MTINFLCILLIIMILFLLVLIGIYFYIRYKSNNNKRSYLSEEDDNNKSKIQQSYNIKSIFNFMEFSKIEDNMIIQKNRKKYLMVVNCQGINFDLMSAVEKNSVEQGFIQYLNTLRNPIQIYIQTRTVNLTQSLNAYKERINTLMDNLTQKEFEYNKNVRNRDYDIRELDRQKFEVTKARNLYEYGTDIVNNTQRMSLNKNILTKKYYIVLSYYPEEANNSIYSNEEINGIAFSELYTRAQSTISLLSVCGINGKILDSNELAELLYTAYNRDEAELYDLNKAISSGYDSLYTTSQDVLEKKMKELDNQIERDAIEKANEAITKVRQEREIEKKLKDKEREYNDIVNKMAKIILENNENVIGRDLVQAAKEEISTKKKQSKKSNKTKEVNVNEQEKVSRARRPTKAV